MCFMLQFELLNTMINHVQNEYIKNFKVLFFFSILQSVVLNFASVNYWDNRKSYQIKPLNLYNKVYH